MRSLSPERWSVKRFAFGGVDAERTFVPMSAPTSRRRSEDGGGSSSSGVAYNYLDDEDESDLASSYNSAAAMIASVLKMLGGVATLLPIGLWIAALASGSWLINEGTYSHPKSNASSIVMNTLGVFEWCVYVVGGELPHSCGGGVIPYDKTIVPTVPFFPRHRGCYECIEIYDWMQTQIEPLTRDELNLARVHGFQHGAIACRWGLYCAVWLTICGVIFTISTKCNVSTTNSRVFEQSTASKCVRRYFIMPHSLHFIATCSAATSVCLWFGFIAPNNNMNIMTPMEYTDRQSVITSTIKVELGNGLYYVGAGIVVSIVAAVCRVMECLLQPAIQMIAEEGGLEALHPVV